MNPRVLLLAVALAALPLLGSPADAKVPRSGSHFATTVDVAAIPAYPTVETARTTRAASRAASARVERPRADRQAREASYGPQRASNGESYLPHPPGCPARAFCACGAAYRIFGKAIRQLWPVSAWYAFPRTSPAPGMVAIPHRHHLFVLEYQVEGNNWMVSDYNSGGHQSRRQVQNIARAVIVNPNAQAGLRWTKSTAALVTN